MDNLKADKMKSSIIFRNILNYIIILTIFSEAFTFQVKPILGVYWNSYFKVYNIVLAFFVFFIILQYALSSKQVYFNKTFLFLFSVIVYFSLYNLILGNTIALFFLPQVTAIFIHSLAFYLLIKLNKGDVRKLFSIYLNIAFFVGLMGLVQFIGYKAYAFFSQLADNQLLAASAREEIQRYLRPFFDFTWFLHSKDDAVWRLTFSQYCLRVNSIMTEPSSFCFVIMPAFFAALASFGKNNLKLLSKIKSLVIITSFVLTFSLTGYIGIFCAILLLSYNCLKRNHIILGVVIAILFAMFSYAINPEIEFRIKTLRRSYNILMERWTVDVVPGIPCPSGQSSYTFLRNTLVTFDVLKDNCVFGKGLGSHQLSFYNHAKKVEITDPPGMHILNVRDAGSLFLRLLSETGLFGLAIFFIFIFKYYIKKRKDSTNYLWIISNAIFVLFLIRLLRQGNYISEGFFFFFWLYYFAKTAKTDQENVIIGKA